MTKIRADMREIYLASRAAGMAAIKSNPLENFARKSKNGELYWLYNLHQLSGPIVEHFEYGDIGGPTHRRNSKGEGMYDSNIYMEFNRARSLEELKELP